MVRLPLMNLRSLFLTCHLTISLQICSETFQPNWTYLVIGSMRSSVLVSLLNPATSATLVPTRPMLQSFHLHQAMALLLFLSHYSLEITILYLKTVPTQPIKMKYAAMNKPILLMQSQIPPLTVAASTSLDLTNSTIHHYLQYANKYRHCRMTVAKKF